MNGEARKLIESERWRQFLESTAAALRIHLVFQVAGTDAAISVCDTCRVCHAPLSSPDFSAPGAKPRAGGEKDLTAVGEADYEMFLSQRHLPVTVRCFPCCATDKTLSLREKACIANELLGFSRYTHRSVERWAACHRACGAAPEKPIILSKFRG
jgi:hypothetical protein